MLLTKQNLPVDVQQMKVAPSTNNYLMPVCCTASEKTGAHKERKMSIFIGSNSGDIFQKCCKALEDHAEIYSRLASRVYFASQSKKVHIPRTKTVAQGNEYFLLLLDFLCGKVMPVFISFDRQRNQWLSTFLLLMRLYNQIAFAS